MYSKLYKKIRSVKHVYHCPFKVKTLNNKIMKRIFHWKYIFFKQLCDFTVRADVKQFFKFIFEIISVCLSFYKELAKSNGNEIVIRSIFNLNFFLEQYANWKN